MHLYESYSSSKDTIRKNGYVYIDVERWKLSQNRMATNWRTTCVGRLGRYRIIFNKSMDVGGGEHGDICRKVKRYKFCIQ